MYKPEKNIQTIFSQEKLVLTVIKDCGTENAPKFRERLGFNIHDVIDTKDQQTVLGAIIVAFEG